MKWNLVLARPVEPGRLRQRAGVAAWSWPRARRTPIRPMLAGRAPAVSA
ncbi:hypothetical protein [Nonomuraea indica]|uniref:Uncharacterized protein n=1 Tax=Nonomuraea indica TaxID=1581193 RepID=A0ABW7ZZU7_9ACTN